MPEWPPLVAFEGSVEQGVHPTGTTLAILALTAVIPEVNYRKDLKQKNSEAWTGPHPQLSQTDRQAAASCSASLDLLH